MKKCLYSILSVAFFAVLCSLGFSQNSFAATITNPYVARSYNAQSPTENNYYSSSVIGNVSLPYNILDGNSNVVLRTLYGVVVNTSLTGTSSANKYNNISNIVVNMEITNAPTYWANYDIPIFISFYETGYTNLLGTCQSSLNPRNQGLTGVRSWSCSGISTDNYTQIGTMEIIIGTYGAVERPNQFIAATQLYSGSDSFVKINSISYDATTSSDPTIGYLQQQIDQNQTIINQNQTIINEQQATTDAINEQTQQEQDQYDQEKQEESEREQSGNEDADQMSGIFQFSIPNPFLPILSMFTDGGSCVSIPTIASMVGSDNTQFCPWFPASVRNVLTPVIGLSSSIILFGFIISWLTGSTRGSVEEVVEVSK